MRIIRVFPRKTKATPDDALVAINRHPDLYSDAIFCVNFSVKTLDLCRWLCFIGISDWANFGRLRTIFYAIYPNGHIDIRRDAVYIGMDFEGKWLHYLNPDQIPSLVADELYLTIKEKVK